MSEGPEEKGFTVTDKRITAREGEGETRTESSPEGPAEPEERKARGEGLKERIFRRIRGEEKERGRRQERPEEESLPEIDFSSFIFSLSSSALLHLGEIPDPISHKREKSLPFAKQTIDILAMLREKTQGNLTTEEERLLDNILYDLRMRYIRAVG